MRCAIVGSPTRNARAAEQPQGQRHLGFGREQRVAGGEDQAQQVVADVVVDRVDQRLFDAGLRHLLAQLHLVAELLVVALEHLLAAQPVERAPLRGGREPCGGVVGHALFGPLLECGDQRVLCEFFGNADVTHHARDGRDDLRRLDPPDGVDRAMDGADSARG